MGIAPGGEEMKLMLGNPDPLAWARSPSPAHEKSGFKASAWEKAIVDLAAAGDARFIGILGDHIKSGVISSDRAKAVIYGGEANA